MFASRMMRARTDNHSVDRVLAVTAEVRKQQDEPIERNSGTAHRRSHGHCQPHAKADISMMMIENCLIT